MAPHIKEFSQLNVSKDPEMNRRLSDQRRIDNLEVDMIRVADSMDILIDQNNKYAGYLEERILAEKENHEFWLDVRKKLVTSGIWATIAIIGTAVLYAAKQWVENH